MPIISDFFQGANINVKDERSGQTPLMAAVLRGKINIVKYLISVGADTTVGEAKGYTAPHGAAFQGRPDVMETLIEAGLDVNSYHEDGFVPLHRVCWGNEQRHADTLRVLLDHGVPHDIMSKDGKTCKDMTANEAVLEVLQEVSGEKVPDDDEDDDEDYYEDDDDEEKYYDDDYLEQDNYYDDDYLEAAQGEL